MGAVGWGIYYLVLFCSGFALPLVWLLLGLHLLIDFLFLPAQISSENNSCRQNMHAGQNEPQAGYRTV
jgi:hypothetical protein